MLEKSISRGKIGIVQKVNSNLCGGIEFKHDLENRKSAFTVGGCYKVDENSTLKGKFDNEGNVQVAYLHNLSRDLKANLTIQSNLKTFEDKSGVNVRLGFTYEPLD